MKPFDNKTEAMKDALESIFPGTKAAVNNCKCPLCKADILEFKDTLSLKEYRISGLCQACQDSVFGG